MSCLSLQKKLIELDPILNEKKILQDISNITNNLITANDSNRIFDSKTSPELCVKKSILYSQISLESEYVLFDKDNTKEAEDSNNKFSFKRIQSDCDIGNRIKKNKYF